MMMMMMFGREYHALNLPSPTRRDICFALPAGINSDAPNSVGDNRRRTLSRLRARADFVLYSCCCCCAVVAAVVVVRRLFRLFGLAEKSAEHFFVYSSFNRRIVLLDALSTSKL